MQTSIDQIGFLPATCRRPTASVRDIRIWLLRNGVKKAGLSSFLDLGCGLDSPKGRHIHEQYCSPALCNDAHSQGWKVTGLDFGDLQREVPWRFVNSDVREVDPANLLGPFDWVNSLKLVSIRSPYFISPGLSLEGGLVPHDQFNSVEDLEDCRYLSFIRNFFSLVLSVMKEGAVFTLNDRDLFMKKDGRLHHVLGVSGKALNVETGIVL